MFIAANTRQPATTSRVFELAEYFEMVISKYYQVQRWQVFPGPVTYVHCMHEYQQQYDRNLLLIACYISTMVAYKCIYIIQC